MVPLNADVPINALASRMNIAGNPLDSPSLAAPRNPRRQSLTVSEDTYLLIPMKLSGPKWVASSRAHL